MTTYLSNIFNLNLKICPSNFKLVRHAYQRLFMTIPATYFLLEPKSCDSKLFAEQHARVAEWLKQIPWFRRGFYPQTILVAELIQV